MNSFNKGGGNGGRVKGLERNNGNLEVREEILSRKKREKDVVISEREVNGGSEGDGFRWSKVFIVDQRRRGEFLFWDILFRKNEFFSEVISLERTEACFLKARWSEDSLVRRYIVSR